MTDLNLPIKNSEQEKAELDQEIDTWKNRRKMAWLALISIIIITLISFFIIPIEKLKVLDSVIQWYFTIMGGIVASYFGTVLFDDKWKRDKKDDDDK